MIRSSKAKPTCLAVTVNRRLESPRSLDAVSTSLSRQTTLRFYEKQIEIEFEIEITTLNKMKKDQYKACFTDAHGYEQTTITNDGETLSMVLRGVTFEDTMFDSFEPVADTNPALLEQFTLYQNGLCLCRIECEIPIAIIDNNKQFTGTLNCVINLGAPAKTGGLDSVDLSIVLLHDGREYRSSGTSGWFEDELIDIQKQLPVYIFIKACINCLYSDYSPYGHGLFGCMMCFKNLKQEYLKVKSKDDFWSIHDRPDRFVQETYRCGEFERRIPGTGYRG